MTCGTIRSKPNYVQLFLLRFSSLQSDAYVSRVYIYSAFVSPTYRDCRLVCIAVNRITIDLRAFGQPDFGHWSSGEGPLVMPWRLSDAHRTRSTVKHKEWSFCFSSFCMRRARSGALANPEQYPYDDRRVEIIELGTRTNSGSEITETPDMEAKAI